MKRLIYSVRWGENGWMILEAKVAIAWERTRERAIRAAANFARYVFEEGRGLTQLKVYNKGNKRISFERTYGRDPKRYKG